MARNGSSEVAGGLFNNRGSGAGAAAARVCPAGPPVRRDVW